MKMNIAAAANAKYMRYLYVMLYSLLKNHPQDQMEIYVFERDFSKKDKGTIGQLCAQFGSNVVFEHVEEKIFQKLPIIERFSLETYFRFCLIDMLPENVERILYLDVDMIITQELHELYNTELGDLYFAVCQDRFFPTLSLERQQKFSRYDDLRYFNAGMMLWNIQTLRKNVAFDDFMEAAEKFNYEIEYPDQDILNYLFYNKVKYVPAEQYNFNCFGGITDEMKESNRLPPILHYCVCSPWAVGVKNELHEIWWEYAKQTPFYVAFLEEQYTRTEEKIMEIFEEPKMLSMLYKWKGSEVLQTFLEQEKRTVYLWGAGEMGERTYQLFASVGMEHKIKGWIDEKRVGKLKKLPIYNYENIKKQMEMENPVIIVTIAKNYERTTLQIKERTKKREQVTGLWNYLLRLEQFSKGI